MSTKKVIVTVAPTSNFQGKKANPAIPIHPDEVATSVRECWDAGAALAGSEYQLVSRGGYVLARGSTRWRAGATKAKTPLPDCLGIRLHERLTMMSYCCPATGQLLAIDVHEVGHEPGDDIVLDLSSLRPAERLAAE